MAGLVLRVELQDGDPFAGSIGLSGSDASIAFEGWISFMAAIDELRRSPCDAALGQLDRDARMINVAQSKERRNQ